MTNREELPVWAKILLGIPVAGDSQPPCAVQPSDSSAAALSGNSDRLRATLRLDRVAYDERQRGRIPLLEGTQ